MANWTLSWDNARLDCQRRGADLASVNDQAEDFFLVGLFNSVLGELKGKQGVPLCTG